VYHFNEKGWSGNMFKSGFTPRFAHACTVFKNQIWVIGGFDGTNELSDMWASSNMGVTWVFYGSDSFSPRKYASLVVQDNLMFLVGGSGTNFDVHVTSNGISWSGTNVVAPNAPGATNRLAPAVGVLNGVIYIIGGQTQGALSGQSKQHKI
jgi:hypothetical protein